MTRAVGGRRSLRGDRGQQAHADGGAAAYWRAKFDMLTRVQDTPAATRDLLLAFTLTRLGEAEEALTMLERAIEKRTGMGAFLHVDPTFTLLRPHPRFASLITRIGQPSA